MRRVSAVTRTLDIQILCRSQASIRPSPLDCLRPVGRPPSPPAWRLAIAVPSQVPREARARPSFPSPWLPPCPPAPNARPWPPQAAGNGHAEERARPRPPSAREHNLYAEERAWSAPRPSEAHGVVTISISAEAYQAITGGPPAPSCATTAAAILDCKTVDRLTALRGPGESYSGVVLHLFATGEGRIVLRGG